MSKNPTLEKLKELMEMNDGSLDLEGCTSLTSLPDGLTVGGWLDLEGCTSLTSLPDGLTVGGSLYLNGCTSLTSLPDGLTVGDWLYLNGCTSLTSLPDGLTVGGSLYLNGCTSLTSLPEGLTVGGWLDLGGANITNPTHYTRLTNGMYVPQKYIYADGILTHVKREKQIGEYTYYVGRIPGRDVITDGVNYAHCKSVRDGVADLNFKKAKDRGAGQYSGYTLESELTPEEAMTMYRIITGACQAGTRQFVDSLGELKEKYTVAEIIELTKGQYNATVFENYFKNK